ncbi:MAG: hypothetical protein M3010_11680 [Candidatus Dormibacteraeota bacterium]|nr:hypothetical protein [Candidatus Dormibacteraeota bacterium]
MPASPRHYLLYARQSLRDFRTILVLFSVGYLAFGVYDAVSHRQPARMVQWAISATFPLMVGVAIYLYSRRTFVEFQEGGVLIRQFMRAALIPYTDIEKARVDSMEHIFDRPDRKRWQTKTVKALYQQKALCLKVRSDDDQQAELRRRLGLRTMVEREAVLPLAEADVALATVKQRLGSRRPTPAVANAARAASRRRRRAKRGR